MSEVFFCKVKFDTFLKIFLEKIDMLKTFLLKKKNYDNLKVKLTLFFIKFVFAYLDLFCGSHRLLFY